MQVATAFKPDLPAGAQKKMVAMSSLMGSIGNNNRGTHTVYRAASSALNALWCDLAVDWTPDGIISGVI